MQSDRTSEQNQPPDLSQLPVTVLKGVGDKLAGQLVKLGIASIQDLLFHLPSRYLDRTRITPIGHLRLNTSVVIQGHVLKAEIKFGRRRSLVCTLEDESGTTHLRFFHFSAAQKERLAPGNLLRCYGDPRMGALGLEFYHPEYEVLDEQQPAPVDQTLTPIYPLTEGISQARLRKLTELAVAYLAKVAPEELIPAHINARLAAINTSRSRNTASVKLTALKQDEMNLSSALAYVHFPPPDAPVDILLAGMHPAQQRLAFEELLAHFLVRQEARQQIVQHASHTIKPAKDKQKQLLNALAFSPTNAQLRVLKEIEADLGSGKPMLRMVQGDVGSGKTLVAALATIHAVEAGLQVAILAPTEILIEQHFANFSLWLNPLGMTVDYLVGRHTKKQRAEILSRLKEGDIQVLLGTHALLQDGVHFNKLGLAIIDEQHRFGVAQRLQLRQESTQDSAQDNNKGRIAHQLIMTATPIPRTLAMTAYAELDYSVIDELPPGRSPVNTVLISQNRREQVIERIRHNCVDGRQVYWVCTLVEESETLAAANAQECAEHLRTSLPDIAIGLVHGRLKPAEKEEAMRQFKCGETQLLVATTVIEVGVDVPNASLMIIENPERLGLAQLHQLRGRVGRGTNASHCVLLYGEKVSEQARKRLQALRETNDGFLIAEHDLALRGPGELMGTRQAGELSYRVADIERDSGLVPIAREAGQQLMSEDPDKANKIIQRWFGQSKHLALA